MTCAYICLELRKTQKTRTFLSARFTVLRMRTLLTQIVRLLRSLVFFSHFQFHRTFLLNAFQIIYQLIYPAFLRICSLLGNERLCPNKALVDGNCEFSRPLDRRNARLAPVTEIAVCLSTLISIPSGISKITG